MEPRVISLDDIQNIIASWWFDYDQGNFDTFPGYFTADAHFSCRSDSGQTAFEEFVTADVSGRDEVVAWQIEHRSNSPYPLRHNGTNVHLTERDDQGAAFRSYIFVTQVVAGSVVPLASGLCLGSARREDGLLRLADLRVVLDFTDSRLFSEAARHGVT
jgi:SnoaL-like domain